MKEKLKTCLIIVLNSVLLFSCNSLIPDEQQINDSVHYPQGIGPEGDPEKDPKLLLVHFVNSLESGCFDLSEKKTISTNTDTIISTTFFSCGAIRNDETNSFKVYYAEYDDPAAWSVNCEYKTDYYYNDILTKTITTTIRDSQIIGSTIIIHNDLFTYTDSASCKLIFLFKHYSFDLENADKDSKEICGRNITEYTIQQKDSHDAFEYVIDVDNEYDLALQLEIKPIIAYDYKTFYELTNFNDVSSIHYISED